MDSGRNSDRPASRHDPLPTPHSPPSEVIAITTDFGITDGYVAQMKGVMLGIAPGARLVDVTHAVPPQDIATAARVLVECVAAFPAETVHLVVVDPGVGTERRIVAAEIGDWRFVAPDNGVLTAVAKTYGVRRAFEATVPHWWRPDFSATFHGRDIMGPLAAHWSRGVDAAEFGSPLAGTLVACRLSEPQRTERGILGEIVRIDGFGNLITNIAASLLPPDDDHAADDHAATVSVGSHILHGVRRTYGDVESGTPLALIGSHGFLEIAVRNGHAQRRLELGIGTAVRVESVEREA